MVVLATNSDNCLTPVSCDELAELSSGAFASRSTQDPGRQPLTAAWQVGLPGSEAIELCFTELRESVD
jgi:hypothetical protein